MRDIAWARRHGLRRARRAVWVWWLLAAALVGVPVAWATPPGPRLSIADGAILDGPPSALDLTFAGPVAPDSVQVGLTHETQHGILLPPPTVSGATVHQPMPSPMVRGTYVVVWTVRTAGTLATGHSSFALKHGIAWPSSGPAPVATVTTRPVPVVPSSSTSAGPSTAAPSDASAPGPSAAAGAPAAGLSTSGVLVGAGLALVLFAGLGVIVVHRWRRDGRARRDR